MCEDIELAGWPASLFVPKNRPSGSGFSFRSSNVRVAIPGGGGGGRGLLQGAAPVVAWLFAWGGGRRRQNGGFLQSRGRVICREGAPQGRGVSCREARGPERGAPLSRETLSHGHPQTGTGVPCREGVRETGRGAGEDAALGRGLPQGSARRGAAPGALAKKG